MRLYDPAGVYTTAEVESTLKATLGSRSFVYKFELLDMNNVLLSEVDFVASCEVSNNFLADIKRKATFLIKDGIGVNYLSDRIKPYIGIKMNNGGYVWWPQGVFLLSTPSRTYTQGTDVMRVVQGYDQLLVLSDDKVADRYAIPAGTTYTAAIQAIISGTSIVANITPTTLTLPVTEEFEPGTSKLTILNRLLSFINYESATFDEDGILICQPYISPSNRAPEYIYATDTTSVISGDVTQTLDTFAVPNKWVRVVSEADRAPFTSTYTNTSLSSPTSTVNRGRTIVSFDTDDAVDQTTLDAKVARLAFEASQVYEVIEFNTACMPIHQNNDVYIVDIDDLALNASFSEHEWTISFKTGSLMRHKARRIVTV